MPKIERRQERPDEALVRRYVRYRFSHVFNSCKQVLKLGLWGMIMTAPALLVLKLRIVPQLSIEEIFVCIAVTLVFVWLGNTFGASRLLAQDPPQIEGPYPDTFA